MIEIINKEYIQAHLERLKKYCARCRWKNSNTCRYCGLGSREPVCWEEMDQ